jgi:hypothetical protein
MKKIMLIVSLFGLLQPKTIFAQLKKVNEMCNVTPCEEGLHCVDTKEGQKCSTCDQSRLDELSTEKSNACKAFGEGSYPKTSPDFQNSLVVDGRVAVDVFDVMLEGEKKCKEARINRENACWNGGDAGHKKQFDQLETIIENISKTKKEMIEGREVYYCSKSTYESRLNTFRSKSNLNFSEIQEKIGTAENDVLGGKKIDCSDIESRGNDCERCADAAKDLLSDGFSGSSDKFPDEYNKIYVKALELQKRAKEVVDLAKEKELCN